MSLAASRWNAFGLTVLGFAAVASVLDALVAATATRLAAGDVLRVLGTSAGFAAFAAPAAWGLVMGCAWLASRAAKAPAARIRLAYAGAAVPVAAALVVLGLDLLSGRGISEKPWVAAARIALIVGAPLVLLVAGQLALAMPRAAAWAGLVTIAVALVADRRVYPALYPSGHLALWLVIFVAVLLVAVWAAPPSQPSRRLAGVVALVLLWGTTVVFFFDPLADVPAARAAAWRDTLFLKRALAHSTPARPLPPPEPDPVLARELRSAHGLDAALLDRAFPGRRRMNVLVVSIDAVRADRLRDPRGVAPNLDALASRGTWFRNAWTTYPFTLVAFASAFTGVYASATDHFRYRELDLFRSPWPLQPTLASLLRAEGWRTEAVVGFPRWVKETLAREGGFERFNAEADPRAAEREMSAEEVSALAIAALDREPGRPFFLWVHFFDPHGPYDPPKPHPFGESPADLYDAEIHYADRELGRVISALSLRDLLASTAIVVFSDHGEDLKEHDHGTALTEEQIHVPLLLVLPKLAPREVTLAADLTDLAPTVLELVGVQRPPHFQGQSLLPCALLDPGAGAAAMPPDVAFCELGGARLPQPRQFAAREGGMKIICHAASRTWQLFDLERDPGESRDLSQVSPDALARMKRVLDSFRDLASTPASAPASRDAPK